MEILRDTTVILSTDNADNTPFAIEEGSVIHREIGGDHYLRLKFSLAEPVHLQVGDHIEAAGGDWYLVEDAYPTYSKSTGGYAYDVQFESYECLWKNFLLKYIPDTSAKETSFVLTGAIETHVNVVLTNLAYHGFQFGGNAFIADVSTFNVKSVTDGDGNETTEAVYALDEAECITYSSSSIYDALNAIADAFECEWWVEEECIYFGFCEKTAATTLGVEYAEGTMTLRATGGSVGFELGENLGDVKRSESTGDYCTRLFAFGSDRNLTDYYRKELVSGYTVASKGAYYTSGFASFSIPAVDAGTVDLTSDILASGTLYLVKTGTEDSDHEGVYSSYTATATGYAITSAVYTSSINYNVVFYLDVNSWTAPDFSSGDYAVLVSGCTIEGLSNSDGYMLALTYLSQEWESVNAFTLDGIVLADSAIKSNSAINGETFYWVYDEVYALTSGEEIAEADEYEITNIRISQVDTSYLTDSDVDITISGVASTRLRLPDADTGDATVECVNGYIQLAGLAEEQYVEGVATFEDIYPRTQCTVSDLYTATASADDDGDGESEDYEYYYVTSEDDFTQNFDEDWIIEGETLHIVFTSGSLNGMDFECGFDALSNGQYFHVVSNTDYGTRLPNETLHPEVGDTFVIYGWDADALEDTTLVADAEEELFEEALDYFRDCLIDPSTYECTFLPDSAYNGGDLLLYDIGQKVRLVHAGYFAEGYRASRIMGYEIPLDMPYDSPTYIVGEEAEYSRLDALEKSIESTAVSGATYISSSSSSSVSISNGDKTSTSSNVYSAKYTDEHFLRKDGDTATGLTTFAAGLAVGDGTYGIDEEGVATLKSVDADEVDGDTVNAVTLNVSGDTTLNTLQAVSTTLSGDLSVSGTSSLADVSVSGDASITGDLTVSGDTSLKDVETENITNSDTITTKNLTVTGTAHFFELVIDKVKSAGGAVMLTPADGFTVVGLAEVTGGWKLYFLAEDDDGNAITNMWQAGDQALCMNFNEASEGSTSEVSNTYWWRLVDSVSEEAEEVELTIGEETATHKCHWIVVSSTDYDGDSTPSVGDEVVMCGNRTDEERQTAIYISAYTSLDDGLTAPLYAHYIGIEDFSLSSHRQTYMDKTGAHFVGNFSVSSGTTIEEYITETVSETTSTYTPYIDDSTGTWWIYKDGAWVDSGVTAGIDLTSLTRVIKIEQALGGFMYVDETETITLSVWDYVGLYEYTEGYTFTIERDSGDDSSDAVWNAAFAAKYDGGTTFELTFSDLNFTDGSRTTKFWVTATESSSGEELEEEVIEY